ncbi:uncharacterized protein LOC118181152 isoform X2 [Stegodyphus dumicola]|nr:uncharacterized protein LOC118181152 isoform X2 [Stegodyphus dumicola]
MFEHKQDTWMLYHSLLSAANKTNTDQEVNNECYLDNSKDTVEIIAGTVKTILTYNLQNVKNELEILEIQVHINRRTHAALFLTLLRSHGISCEEADRFYETIASIFPTFDCKLYVQLCYECSWSEYFIEVGNIENYFHCAKQLPSNILAVLIRKLLDISWDEENFLYYTWHIILEVLIHKFCESEKCSALAKCYPFHYKFICSEKPPVCITTNYIADDSMSVDPSANINTENHNNMNFAYSYDNDLMDLYKSLYQNLCSKPEQGTETITFVNILLHACKTLFKFYKKIIFEKITHVPEEIMKLQTLLEHFLQIESVQMILKSAISVNADCLLTHTFMMESWGINECYLTFLTFYSLKDLKEFFHSQSELANFEDMTSNIKTKILHTPVFEILISLNPLLKEDLSEYMDSHMPLLLNTIKYHYPSASVAAEIILMHPEIWEGDNVISTLEENTYCLDPEKTYALLINCAMNVKSDTVKISVVKLLLKVLSEASADIYNEALQYILKTYGFTEKLRLPDFCIQLDQFTRKTLSCQEAASFLLPLFIQSPKVVLENVIEQAVLKASKDNAVIQTLKYVPSLCKYQSSDEDIPPLIEVLAQYYLKAQLKLDEWKDLMILTENLIKVHAENNILSIDLFLTQCIMPGLKVEDVRKADFPLECLNVSFSILLEKNALCMTSRTFIMFAKTIIQIINDCIQSSCGRLKEIAANVLALMGKLQNFAGILDDSSKAELWLEVSSCNPIVFLYSIEILPLNLDMNELSLELAWMWSCITKDINFYEDKIATCGISYISLLNILIPLLLHSSKSEWLDSAHFIKIYLKHAENKRKANENMPWVFPKNNSSTYLVFTCLLDCLHFILLDKPTEIAYIISCFSNTVMV